MAPAKGSASYDLSPSVIRSIGDKVILLKLLNLACYPRKLTFRKHVLQTYDRRKIAALEVERLVHSFAAQNQVDRVLSLVNTLSAYAQAEAPSNTRKGGLLCLAAVAVGLASQNSALVSSTEFLSKVFPPIITACTDSDPRVRYYSLEALYNLAKSARTAILDLFGDIFDVLFKLCDDSDYAVQNASAFLDDLMKTYVSNAQSFDVDSFLPTLTACLTVESSKKRQFLLGWVALLDSLPHADRHLLAAVPSMLPAMLEYLDDSDFQVKQAAEKLLSQLADDIAANTTSTDISKVAATLADQLISPRDGMDSDQIDDNNGGAARATALRWLKILVGVAPVEVSNNAPQLLRACLKCLDRSHQTTHVFALQLNEALLCSKELLACANIANMVEAAALSLDTLQETAQLESLKWIEMLLHRSKGETESKIPSTVVSALCESLSSTSERVVIQAALVLGIISNSDLSVVFRSIVNAFRGVSGAKLLQRRGASIVEQLCQVLGSKLVFVSFVKLLEVEEDVDFARMLAQAFGLVLLTSPPLQELRDDLTLSVPSGGSEKRYQLFVDLFPGLCHSIASVMSLTLLSGAYKLAADMIASLAAPPLLREMPATVIELTQLVTLLEAPAFAPLRLELLSHVRRMAILQVFYSILMILPQGEAFNLLQRRVNCIPEGGLGILGGQNGGIGPGGEAEVNEVLNSNELLQTFVRVQKR